MSISTQVCVFISTGLCLYQYVLMFFLIQVYVCIDSGLCLHLYRSMSAPMQVDIFTNTGLCLKQYKSMSAPIQQYRCMSASNRCISTPTQVYDCIKQVYFYTNTGVWLHRTGVPVNQPRCISASRQIYFYINTGVCMQQLRSVESTCAQGNIKHNGH